MSDANKEFFSLLDTVTKDKTVKITNSDGNQYDFKPLTTSQLKKIVQTVIDTSTTQTAFHSTIYEIMKQNALNTSKPVESFNVLDKLLFIVETRINAVSPTLFIRGDEANTFIPADLNEVKTKLSDLVNTKKELIENKIVGDESITVNIGIPLITTEQTVNKEIYAKLNINSEDPDVAQEVLGTAFLIEISKWMQQLTVLGQTLDLNEIPINSKLEAIEKIPASVVEKVIDYIEKTKQMIDSCLIVSNKLLPLNGTLFSVR